ncbi:protein unc-93 homolog A-like [Lingula anatina]|uniref:Protein unc-93 homolog A-like n=1 Tax=Lingula anatina TaxID=7574 RepID=A0A2R2MQ12_LINAN|nr:protein unc-93 homolog A-like [Lingula anatina]|eukprot:XP_023932330.1 protein unc-93 homolog A-like [Lingula anatina]
MLGYSPFITLMNLEVILNADIGSFVMLCVFCGTLISFATAPFITRLLGAKGSVLVGWVAHAVFAAVHFSPISEILLPVAVVVGIGHAQTWITQGVYVATLALEYASATGQPQESVMGLFSGIFFTINTFNGVWGNLISSLVLVKPTDPALNSTEIMTGNLSELCGPAFCPWEDTSGTHIREPDQLAVTIVLCAFIGLDILAFLITSLFLKNIHPETSDSLHSALDFCGTILKMCHEKNLVFLLLPFLWIGFEIEFMMTEFTKAGLRQL